MNLEKNDLYRIDLLKVKQKLYDMYPAGSQQRRMMIQAEKMHELGKLSSTVNNYPVQLVKESAPRMRSIITRNIIKGLLGVTLGVSALVILTLYAKTIIEIFLLSSASIVFIGFSFKSFFSAFHDAYLLKRFFKQLHDMHQKIDSLRRDIFDDPSR